MGLAAFAAGAIVGKGPSQLDGAKRFAEAWQRQDFAAMYTSYLEQPGGVQVQLVKYD